MYVLSAEWTKINSVIDNIKEQENAKNKSRFCWFRRGQSLAKDYRKKVS
jgi:hypothetical protein